MHRIGPRIINNVSFLKAIAKSKNPAIRANKLKLASTDELLSIVEIAFNILKGKFTLSPSQRRRLLPFATAIREISRLRSEKSAKRVLQRGGAIGTAIVSIITPILLEILRSSLQSNGS
jgi:hypothetical protein